ncbi:unnamed protein product [Caenorhabditis bovis]|uniref:Very-long-chain (3R)-3-hydroxyacyl-CoA dehydratase n=1 Tax=Caenorhabditis bovis TaxID=2654633 RepID=A0A8S1EYK8_9PELO|nr:unnamed protein product [Caenorhabditis bovis]
MAKQLNWAEKFYLFTYNVLLFVMHFIALIDISQERWKGTFNYSHHHQFVVICTVLQFGDVLHAKLGLTSTHIPTAILQIVGRLLVLVTAKSSSSLYTVPTSFFLLVAYLSIECIRYPYYALKIFKYDSIAVSWLRYNAWIVFYPIGFICEAATFFNALTDHYQTGAMLWKKPFGLPINFDFSILAAIALFFTFPIIVNTLLKHMVNQRNAKNRAIAKKIR